MAGICPGECDEDFMSIYGGDGKIKAQPIKSRPQSCIIFEDSDEKTSMWLVAVESPSPTYFLNVELRAVEKKSGKGRKVATLAFSQKNLECLSINPVDGLKLKGRHGSGFSGRLVEKNNDQNFEFLCCVNRDHVSKLFKEVPFWETEEWRMEEYNKWWKKAIACLPY